MRELDFKDTIEIITGKWNPQELLLMQLLESYRWIVEDTHSVGYICSTHENLNLRIDFQDSTCHIAFKFSVRSKLDHSHMFSTTAFDVMCDGLSERAKDVNAELLDRLWACIKYDENRRT